MPLGDLFCIETSNLVSASGCAVISVTSPRVLIPTLTYLLACPSNNERHCRLLAYPVIKATRSRQMKCPDPMTQYRPPPPFPTSRFVASHSCIFHALLNSMLRRPPEHCGGRCRRVPGHDYRKAAEYPAPDAVLYSAHEAVPARPRHLSRCFETSKQAHAASCTAAAWLQARKTHSQIISEQVDRRDDDWHTILVPADSSPSFHPSAQRRSS